MKPTTAHLSWLRQKLNTNTWQTAMMVLFIVGASVWLSLWLFWRSLYLPELKNHANYLASELHMIEMAEVTWADNPEVKHWVSTHAHLIVVDDPREFPEVTEKVVVGTFTDILAEETAKKLGRPIKVFFKFKPVPKLWIQDSLNPDIWLQEPITDYSKYGPTSFFMFIFGLPLLTLIIIILLVRALNRPLKQLEQAASNYIHTGTATHLPVHIGSNEIKKVNTAFNRLFTSLNQAQKERTIMLAGISHDLRTPLTRMRLTAEMLGDEFFKEGLIYDIEDMDAILEQFISFMKDGSDEATRPTNLDSICHEIMVQYGTTSFIYQNNVHHTVLVRPLSIKRLLINLINNAIRYGKEPIHLVIDILPATDTTLYPTLLLCVKDEGEGVAEDQLERIMQPFERGETARTTQGSGLGLAIVGRVAALHHGHVEAINHPEGGLQVCVYIPLNDPDITPSKNT